MCDGACKSRAIPCPWGSVGLGVPEPWLPGEGSHPGIEALTACVAKSARWYLPVWNTFLRVSVWVGMRGFYVFWCDWSPWGWTLGDSEGSLGP